MPWEELNGSSYDVEISGWDLSEDFFVEKGTLHWHGKNSKKILLRNRIHKGGVVFVRLAQPVGASNNFPVAYQAEEVAAPDRQKLSEVTLVQLRPKKNPREDVDLVGAEEEVEQAIR